MARTLTGKSTPISADLRRRIVEEYSSGESVLAVAERHGVDGQSVRRFVRAAGMRVRRSVDPPPSIKVNAFDDINETTAYWVGYVLAAGYFKSAKLLELTKAQKDAHQVEAFAAFIGDVRIRPASNGKTRQLRVRSPVILNGLARFGVVADRPRGKVVGLESNRHFWRGYVDGAGTIHCRGIDGLLSLQLRGSQPLLEQFCCYAKPFVKNHFKIHPVTNTFNVQFAGWRALAVLSEIYRDCSVSLARKREVVERAKAA